MDARERILWATVDQLGKVGYERLTITAVAAAAGVSRPTVYSAFATRENLASEAVLHASVAALVRIAEKAADATNAADFLVELMMAGVEEFRSSPALVQVALARANGAHTGMTVGDPFDAKSVELACSFLAPLVQFDPTLADDLPEIAELCMRVLLSIVMFDSELARSPGSLRGFLHRRIVPALGRAGQIGPVRASPSR